MAKLWQKDYSFDETIERFTVGNDYELDRELAAADAIGSIAHATMLSTIGILSADDAARLTSELVAVYEDATNGRFTILRQDEDCHTAIENRLTEAVGEAGKRIHTGRSRNDQVITMVRLYAREYLIRILERLAEVAGLLLERAEGNASVPMAGRTHMQPAMPSSVGLFFAAFGEQLLDDARLVETTLELCDRCPLGSAASYGVPLPLDRELTSRLLGFAELQNNVLAVNNSRGKLEAAILDALDHIAMTLGKLAQDLIVFSLPEFGYFRLPDELCSGSSIMPQKKNPDGLELLRARSAAVSSYAMHCRSVVRSLPSGYNRDFQDTKEPLLRGLATVDTMLRVASITVEKIQVDTDRLIAGFDGEIFATDAVLDKVGKGASFRDAYREVAKNPAVAGDAVEAIARRTSVGTPGNLGLDVGRRKVAALRARLAERDRRISNALRALTGRDVSLVRSN